MKNRVQAMIPLKVSPDMHDKILLLAQANKTFKIATIATIAGKTVNLYGTVKARHVAKKTYFRLFLDFKLE